MNEWILVKDRLPNNLERVLIWDSKPNSCYDINNPEWEHIQVARFKI